MDIKKKLLIALLTATVSVAGGFAACDNSNNPPPDPDGPGNTTPVGDNITVSDEAYEIAAANGYNGTKDEWLSDLKVEYGKSDKDFKSVTADEDGNVVIAYSDDSTHTITMAVKIYKVISKDNVTGETLAGAWFEIGYLDENSMFKSTDTVSNTFAKSDENGVAKFFVTPDGEIDYIVKIADPTSLATYLNTMNAPEVIPLNYNTAFGTLNGFAVTSLSFKDSKTVEAMFENSANYFYNAEKTQIPYSKTTVRETNGTLNGAFKVTVNANVYSYIYFNSYVSPDTGSTADDDVAAAAASGLYKFTITPADGATLYKFSGTTSNAPLNENKVPAIAEYVTGGTEGAEHKNGSYQSGVYTGTNSITLNITKDVVRGNILFGLSAQTDCEITVTVERIGDAEEDEPIEITHVDVPSNIGKYPEKPDDTKLVLMPVTGAVNAVKGTDGFYHVGSENGPVLLIQLNNALSRVAPVAISQLPTQKPTENDEPLGDKALTLTEFENGKPVAIYNFTDAIAAYSARANGDGVYGVNELLYNFLQLYGDKAMEAMPNSENNWLLACQYYQPNAGMPVSGEGTASNPFVLTSDTNRVDVSDSAYLRFYAPETGIYIFNTNGGTLTPANENFKSALDVNNRLCVCVTSTDTPVTLMLNGSGAVTVSVDRSTRNIQAEYDTDAGTTAGSENTPVLLLPGINNIEIGSVNDEGVWVSFKSYVRSEYVFTLYGDNAVIIYNGVTYTPSNPLTINVTDTSIEFKLLLTAKNENGEVVFGNFMLNIA